MSSWLTKPLFVSKSLTSWVWVIYCELILGPWNLMGAYLPNMILMFYVNYTKLSIDVFVLLVHGKFYVTCHVIYVKIYIIQTQNLVLDLITLCSHKFKSFIPKLRFNSKYLIKKLGLIYMDIIFQCWQAFQFVMLNSRFRFLLFKPKQVPTFGSNQHKDWTLKEKSYWVKTHLGV
jgi:hypothetical protein